MRAKGRQSEKIKLIKKGVLSDEIADMTITAHMKYIREYVASYLLTYKWEILWKIIINN